MIKPLQWNEQVSATHVNVVHTKVSELIDAVNKLEAIVYCCEDDDDDVTREVQQVVDDVRGKHRARGRDELRRRIEEDDEVETYFVTTDDGLLFDLVKMCVDNPEIRLGQAICNVSDYNKVWLEGEDGELKDLWNWKGKD